jgi:hypothetical protein
MGFFHRYLFAPLAQRCKNPLWLADHISIHTQTTRCPTHKLLMKEPTYATLPNPDTLTTHRSTRLVGGLCTGSTHWLWW